MDISGLIIILVWTLILIFVLAVFIWGAKQIIAALGGPPMALLVVQLICLLILLLWLVHVLTGFLPPPGRVWK